MDPSMMPHPLNDVEIVDTMFDRPNMAIQYASTQGNVKWMQRLSDLGVDLHILDSDHRTLLHLAVLHKHHDAVQYLLQVGVSIHAVDRYGKSPMDYAVEGEDQSIVSLLQRFVDTRLPPRQNHETEADNSDVQVSLTQLFAAIKAGDTQKIKQQWLDGVEINATDQMGRTSLHIAAEHGQLSIVELLLSADADVNVTDCKGKTPFSIAQDKHHNEIADTLRLCQEKRNSQSHLNAFKDTITSHEIPKAFQAAKHGHLHTLQELVPDSVPVHTKDYDLRTLLHIASAEGHVEIAKYLILQGANVNALDRWGNTPLAEANSFAHNDVARLLAQYNATESGAVNIISIEDVDIRTLHTALEVILRAVTRKEWVMGFIYCPVRTDQEDCVLVAHHLWHHNKKLERHDAISASHCPRPLDLNENIARSSGASPIPTSDPIRMYRRAAAMLMMDPGQGHIGRVFSTRQPEWLALSEITQSDFFLLPFARQAGMQIVMSVPMIHKTSTIAVFSWHSHHMSREDMSREIPSVQRLLKSVTAMSILRQQIKPRDSEDHELDTDRLDIPRFQYCLALANAITCNGHLLSATKSSFEDPEKKVLSLSLEWELFAPIHCFATSMSSEDHAAVLPLFKAVGQLLEHGFFTRSIARANTSIAAIAYTLEEKEIRTKWTLLLRVNYYLEYFQMVHPPDDSLLLEINELVSLMRKHLADALRLTTAPAHTMQQYPASMESLAPSSSKTNCALCAYNVTGHIHRNPIQTFPSGTSIPPRCEPHSSQALFPSSNEGTIIRTHNSRATPLSDVALVPLVRSPVFHTASTLFQRLQSKYKAFERECTQMKFTFSNRSSTVNPFTTMDVYDVIGGARSSTATKASQPDSTLQEIVCLLNNILQDTNSDSLSLASMCTLHQLLLHSPKGGAIRNHAAVGYATSRIYRVFMPAMELPAALTQMFETLQRSSDQCQTCPLLCAYYAYSSIVYYIHPFLDGNGRLGRLFSNLIAKKNGFPALLRATDKIIELEEYLHRAMVTLMTQQTCNRMNRRVRMCSGRRDNLSMWF